MRLWLRLGSGWGVSLGFWGTLIYALGYLMLWALILAAVVAAVLVAAALFTIAVLAILIAAAYGWIRDPNRRGGYWAQASPRLRALWQRLRSWSGER